MVKLGLNYGEIRAKLGQNYGEVPMKFLWRQRANKGQYKGISYVTYNY